MTYTFEGGQLVQIDKVATVIYPTHDIREHDHENPKCWCVPCVVRESWDSVCIIHNIRGDPTAQE